MNKNYFARFAKASLLLSIGGLLGIALIIGGCNKRRCHRHDAPPLGVQQSTGTASAKSTPEKALQGIYTVAGIRDIAGSSSEVFFNENEQSFPITDDAMLNTLKSAQDMNKAVRVMFNPWEGILYNVRLATTEEQESAAGREITHSDPRAMRNITKINEDIDLDPQAIGIMNTTSTGLANVIPDFQTAQMMFDYITHQCCALSGPYAVDHCITFQYCQDGCYARAHKMCWILNNKYKYGTKKIFSFANAGTDKLCVQAQKWGGCCIRWWYHVAPLVTVNTPKGPKAYVFDPAMFDQPVLLSVWLHAQENPACVTASYTPHVSMINIQPTSSYTPVGTTGTFFSTDPSYSATNSTLVSYMSLISCP